MKRGDFLNKVFIHEFTKNIFAYKRSNLPTLLIALLVILLCIAYVVIKHLV